MILNKALFNDNGNSGYVLKPEFLRFANQNFDPNNLNTMKNKKVIHIKIISAQNLPKAEGIGKCRISKTNRKANK